MTDFKTFVDQVFNRKNPRTPALVEVQWLDAEDINNDWLTNDDIDKSGPAPTLTVGYLVRQDTKAIKLVSLINHTHAAHGITIPAGMVQKITKLSRQ